MRKGLTEKIDAITEKVAELECIKPYILCGGTALAMQIGHRKSEDLDFMMWRKSKNEKPEVDCPTYTLSGEYSACRYQCHYGHENRAHASTNEDERLLRYICHSGSGLRHFERD